MQDIKTLIVGGSFRCQDGVFFVQKRSWEMLRIFSDYIKHPIFAMREEFDETLGYELPKHLSVVPVSGKKKYYHMLKHYLGYGIIDVKLTQAIDDCEVVYLRLPSWECWSVFKYAKRKQKKIIASYHGDWVDAYEKMGGTKFKQIASKLFSVYVGYILKRIAKNAEVLFCVGPQLFKKYSIYSRSAVEFANFLHSAKDVVEFKKKEIVPPYKVLFIGALEERKGLRFLLSAISLVREKVGDVNLTIVGDGPLKQSLKSLVKHYALDDSVFFKGYVQYGDELLGIYRSHDVFVLPSISSEGMPKVIMESMSQGTPVIATDVGSVKAMLHNGSCGLLIKAMDESKLSDALEEIFTNENLRYQLQKNGLRLALRSTCKKQRSKVLHGLQDTVPGIVGSPEYLTPDLSGD